MAEGRKPKRNSDQLKFADFYIDLHAGELHKNGTRVRLQDQPFQVLVLLAQRANEVVTREEIRRHLWPADTFVDFDNSLNAAVAKIREALADSSENPKFIETVPRRGYRFIAPVEMPHNGTPVVKVQTPSAIPHERRMWRLALAALLLGIALGGSGYWVKQHYVRRLTDKDTIVLADFDNRTGDAVFDDALKQALAVGLGQSPFLNILSDQRVSETLRMMGRPTNEHVTADVGRELCLRTGSRAVIMGSIASLGNEYVVGLNASNCQNGDVLAEEQVHASGKEDVLRALDKAVSSLREKLGESLSSINKFDAQIAEATTPSLEALKAYSMAVKTGAEKGDRAAVPFYVRAIEIDPKFAVAYAGLGSTYGDLNQASLAAENLQKAYELRERASEREKLSITADYYIFTTGELEKEAQTYELWMQSYPRDAASYSNLGATYAVLGQWERALDYQQQAIRLEPNHVQDYTNLCQTYLGLNRLDEAKTILERAFKLKMEGGTLRLMAYYVALLSSDTAQMRAQVAGGAGKLGDEDILLSAQSDTEAYYGRLRNARDFSRRAIKSAIRADSKETAALWQVNAALREAEFGNTNTSKEGITAALSLARGRDVNMLSALALARSGDITRARAMIKDLEKSNPSNTVLKVYWLPTLEAAIELNSNNSAGALLSLEASAPYELGAPPPTFLGTLYPAYLRGQAYLAANNGTAATAEFQKFLDYREIVVNFPLGALARLQLGRAYAMSGDTAKARLAYQDFLILWKDADPDIPVLKQAKAEYAKLQ